MTALLIANLVVSSLVLLVLLMLGAFGLAAIAASRRKRAQLSEIRREATPVSKEQVADFMARARARQAK